MVQVCVTRGGQITISKEFRESLEIKEGDIVQVNKCGEMIMVSKKDPKAFEKGGFLPENFESALRDMRKFSFTDRLKRAGITE